MRDCNVLFVTKVEVFHKDFFLHPLQYLLRLGLIDGIVKKTVLERDELNSFNLIDSISHESSNWLTSCDKAEERLLQNCNNADNKIDFFTKFGRDVSGLFFESGFGEAMDLGGEAVDFNELFFGEEIGKGFELNEGNVT